APVSFRFRGFAVTRRSCDLPYDGWWVRVTFAGGSELLFATDEEPAAWHGKAEGLFGHDAQLGEYADALRQIYRVAAFRQDRMDGCLFVGPADAAPSWEAVKACFDAPTLSSSERRTLLSGRSARGMPETGRLICTCFGIGLNAIRDAIATRGAANVEEIGRALRAGTNCGSCLPELKRIVSERAAAIAPPP